MGSSFIINPALSRFPEEAELMGAMVLGYGELEFSYTHVAGLAAGDRSLALHAASFNRSETARLGAAYAIATRAFGEIGMATDHEQAYEGIRHCLKIRNQWAHAHWGVSQGNLYFQKFDDPDLFASRKPLDDWRLITLQTLQSQAEYFQYCRECCLILEFRVDPIRHSTIERMPEKKHKPHMQSQPKKGRSP